MKWSNELTLEFVNLYEQEPVIWDPGYPQHKDRTAVNEAWQRIENSMSCECSVTELKKKKESLMAIFRPLLTKFKTSRKTGSGGGDAYRPSWFAFETMVNFLGGIYQPKIAIDTEDPLAGADDAEQNAKGANQEKRGLKRTATKIQLKTVTPSSSPPIRESKKRNINTIEKTERRVDNAYKIMKMVANMPDQDECSQYADLLATKLRAFDEERRDILMHEIDHLIFKAKMQQHSQPLSSTSSNNRSNNDAKSLRKHSPSLGCSNSSPNSPQTDFHHLDLSPGRSTPSPSSS